MNRDSGGLGGSFSVDGENVEVDLAEFGWPGDRAAGAEGAGSGSDFGDEADGGDATDPDDGRIRLQKALAHAGVASRRACESLITSGRVTINGQVEHELGSRIDPTSDVVRVDGVVVQLDVSKRYFVLNKPTGVVSTMSDEHDRPDLQEFTRKIKDRLYNVGRLDTDTSGLLILTNDGELAHKLAHPSFGVSKTYVAKVRGRMTGAVIQRLKHGIELKDGPIHADRARILTEGGGGKYSLVEITLHSGRNRIVRRMLAEVGFPVVELVRRQFGPLNLGTLGIGEMRELSAGERGALLSVTSEDGSGAGSGDGSAPQSRKGWARAKNTGAKGGRGAGKRRDEITAGRPGDGKGARGMRGVAARGNPHGRRSAEDAGSWQSRSDAVGEERRNSRSGERSYDRGERGGRGAERSYDRGGRDTGRSYDRDSRDSRDSRGDRGSESRGGFERGERSDWNNRAGFSGGSGRARVWSDRNDRNDRNDRKDRNDRNDRGERADRGGYSNDRGAQGRGGRPEYGRGDSARGGSGAGYSRGNTGHKPQRGGRDHDRAERDDRRGGFGGERGGNRGYGRSDRNDRDDRRGPRGGSR